MPFGVSQISSLEAEPTLIPCALPTLRLVWLSYKQLLLTTLDKVCETVKLESIAAHFSYVREPKKPARSNSYSRAFKIRNLPEGNEIHGGPTLQAS